MTPEQIKALPLGAPVAYTARLDRVLLKNDRKRWERCEIPGRIACVYIGWRTLADGRISYDENEGYAWDAEHHFDAALVVYDPRCKPVFVPMDALVEVPS